MFELFQKWATDEAVTTPVTTSKSHKRQKTRDVTTVTPVTTPKRESRKNAEDQSRDALNPEIAPDITKKVVTPVTLVTESATDSELSNLAGSEPVTTQSEEVVTPVTGADWARLTLSDLEVQHLALRIESDEFGDLWLVSTEAERELADDTAPIFTVAEARRIIGLPEVMARQIHGFKKAFGGRFERLEE